MSTGPGRRSLVDGAEEAMRNWLAASPHREGDRLPPEHQLAEMLGVSRGTLRTALRRLEESGEIRRRQGSGTFVGRAFTPRALAEGLERLVPYSVLARRRGLTLSVRHLEITRRPIGSERGRAFGLPPSTPAPTVSRLLLTDGRPAAIMVDVVHPDLPLPGERALHRAIERGDMMLDVLLAQSVPVAFAETRVQPRLLTPDDTEGALLEVDEPVASLELEEFVHVSSGAVVQHARDLFNPLGLELHVVRWLAPGEPTLVPIAGNGTGRRARRQRLSAGDEATA